MGYLDPRAVLVFSLRQKGEGPRPFPISGTALTLRPFGEN